MKNIYYFIIGLRLKQWIKNFIILVPVIFSGNLFNILLLKKSIFIFILFSILVGSTYIINDYFDIEKDKKHPKKKNRPLASGKLNKIFALISSNILIFLSLFISYFYFGNIIVLLFILYLANTILYTAFIKNIVILDVFSIAIGFVIRGLIGTFIIGVNISEWFLIILFFGALFLGFLKRYQEVKLGVITRKNIESYNEEFLKQIISMIISILLFIYTLYTFQSVQSKLIILSLPVVVFGIIRYYYNIFFLKKYSDSIENILLKDKYILISFLIFCIIIFIIIYL